MKAIRRRIAEREIKDLKAILHKEALQHGHSIGKERLLIDCAKQPIYILKCGQCSMEGIVVASPNRFEKQLSGDIITKRCKPIHPKTPR